MKQRLLFILISILITYSCSTSEYDIDSIKSYLNEKPDIALSELKKIDISILNTKSKAKYALLYSIALDKNYIDLKHDSIIRPAVDYYLERGTDNDKAYTYFYLGRIYENNEDYENAMLCAIKALNLDTLKIDYNILKRIYGLKGAMYHRIWRHEESLHAFSQAAHYANMDMDITYYIYCYLNIGKMNNILERYDNLSQNIDTLARYVNDFSIEQKHNFNNLILNYYIYTNAKSEIINSFIANYINEYPQLDLVNWKTIAIAYLRQQRYQDALDYLNLYSKYNNIDNDASYYSNLAKIQEYIGDYKGALSSRKQYSEINGKNDLFIYRSNIALIEKQYLSLIAERKRREIITYSVIFITFLSIILLYVTIKYCIDKRNLVAINNDFRILQTVERKYNDILSLVEDDGNLKSRLISFTTFMESPRPDSISKIASHPEMIEKNKNYIIDNIALVYTVHYPEFVLRLKNYGLTTSEIGFCCLYIIGLYPEDIKMLIKRKNVYNINSLIRKKLQLNLSDTNLDIWLKNIFTELYPKANQ